MIIRRKGKNLGRIILEGQKPVYLGDDSEIIALLYEICAGGLTVNQDSNIDGKIIKVRKDITVYDPGYEMAVAEFMRSRGFEVSFEKEEENITKIFMRLIEPYKDDEEALAMISQWDGLPTLEKGLIIEILRKREMKIPF